MPTSRREILQRGVLAFAAGAAGVGPASARTDGARTDGARGASPGFDPRSTPFPIAETTSGRVQGMNFGGVACFRGIPYGAPTGGAQRFRPARPVKPWAGVREAFGFAQVAPQAPVNLRRDYARLIEWDKQPGGMGEDCLTVNVWTPGLRDGLKRPIFVSFHGGNFVSGSSNSPIYHGDALARAADAVVITVNHRLGAFGYLHLADIAGAQFAGSGNVGMTDLVAALAWVKANAEAFGGDPACVTIFGQSGGGRKVSVAMAMPSAVGLFHRAAVQSGSLNRILDQEQASRIAHEVLKALEIAPSNAAALQAVPMLTLLRAQGQVMAARGGSVFTPVVDGALIQQHPFEPGAPAVSADVPMLIGSTLDESATAMDNFDLTEPGLRTYAAKRFGKAGDTVIEAYRRAYPTVTPFLIQARIDTQLDRRARALRQAEQKARQGRAPAWLYRFDAFAPAYGGRYGAVHGIDTSLVFHNDLATITSAPPPEMVRLRDELTAVWVAFARTGKPHNKLVPEWPAYDLSSRTSMLFGPQTRAVADPDRELRLLNAGPDQGPPTDS